MYRCLRSNSHWLTACRFAKMFWSLSETLLKEKKVKVHPVDLKPEGLKGVLDGLVKMRKGRVSGKKLVYSIDETS